MVVALLGAITVAGPMLPPVAIGAADDALPNVLLICIDVLRADHVGAYGYGRPTTPALDALARSGVVFERARSPAAWTKPSVPSYFTGRLPRQHGVYQGAREQDGALVADVLRPEEVTLAELLGAHGYRTLAVVGNPAVAGSLGFAQGFDRYLEDEEDGREIRRQFLAWLDADAGDGPFFAYLHFNDVHLPYDPPPEYRTAFGGGTAGAQFTTGAWRLLRRRLREGKAEISDADRQGMIDLYDGELKYVDDQIGMVVADLERRKLLDRTLIVVLADHGEELLDHGGIDHGTSLYDELLHVPLLVRFPGGEPAGTRVAEPVGLVDVLPTVAAHLGIDAPAEVAGHSLLPLMANGPPTPSRPVYAEGIHNAGYQQTVVAGNWKYIVTVPVKDPARSVPKPEAGRLTEGLRVEVEGVQADAGYFAADEVEIKLDQDEEREGVTGSLDALDGDEIVVLGYHARIEADTRLMDHERQVIERDALRMGDQVKIYGRALSPPRFKMTKLKVRDPNKRKKAMLEGRIVGAVRMVGDEIVFQLVGREVRVDRKGEIVTEADELEAVAPIPAPPRAEIDDRVPAREELYQLADDPGERRDLIAAEPEQLGRMRTLLAQVQAGLRENTAPERLLDRRQIEALRQLGYVE